MAKIDVAECRAAGNGPYRALELAKAGSVMCWTGVIDGRPEAMFGVVPGSMITGLGYPWLLGTDKARSAQRLWLATAPGYVARIEALFPRLEGRVSQRNLVAIRWLRRLGFVVDADPRDFRGEPMLHFHKGF